MTKKFTGTPQEFNLHSNCNILVTGSAKVFGLTKKADIPALSYQSVPNLAKCISKFLFFPLVFAFIHLGAWWPVLVLASTTMGTFIVQLIADRKNCWSMKIVRQKRPNGKKIYLYYEYGRAKGDRVKTGLFLYAKPANAIEKQHNKQTADLLLVKQGQQVLEQQAIRTGYIPEQRFKANFLEYTMAVLCIANANHEDLYRR